MLLALIGSPMPSRWYFWHEYGSLAFTGSSWGLVAALGGGDGNIDPAKWVYLTMAALYVWSASVITLIKVEDRTPDEESQGSILSDLSSGFKYVLRTPIIAMLLGCNFLMVFFSLTYFMLLPGFAKDVLNAGPDDLGY